MRSVSHCMPRQDSPVTATTRSALCGLQYAAITSSWHINIVHSYKNVLVRDLIALRRLTSAVCLILSGVPSPHPGSKS